MNEPINNSELLTKKEVAQRLSVSPMVVSRLEREGVLPRISFTPRSVRYRSSDVEKLILRSERLRTK